VLWLRVVAGGIVTIPLLVREVLKIEAGDYVRLNISQVIKKAEGTAERENEGEKQEVSGCLVMDVSVLLEFHLKP